MNPYKQSDEELTGDLPPEYLPRPSISLVPILPEDEEPTVVEFLANARRSEINHPTPPDLAPIPKFFYDFFKEWRRQIRLAQEYESIHYPNTFYQKFRRLCRRCVSHVQANQRQKWDFPQSKPFVLKEFIEEWRRQNRLTREYERIHYPHSLHQKSRRLIRRLIERAKVNQKPNWEFLPQEPLTLKGLIREWRFQNRIAQKYEEIHYAHTINQKIRRRLQTIFAPK